MRRPSSSVGSTEKTQLKFSAKQGRDQDFSKGTTIFQILLSHSFLPPPPPTHTHSHTHTQQQRFHASYIQLSPIYAPFPTFSLKIIHAFLLWKPTFGCPLFWKRKKQRRTSRVRSRLNELRNIMLLIFLFVWKTLVFWGGSTSWLM